MREHRRLSVRLAALALLGGFVAALGGCASDEDGVYHLHYHWQPTSPPTNASVD